jgi:hypothetical protein
MASLTAPSSINPARWYSNHLAAFHVSPLFFLRRKRTMDELKASRKRVECKMNSLSLARIMYGTSEDYRATSSMSIPGYRSLARPLGAASFSRVEALSFPETLSGLLQKAWAALSHKS